MWADDDARLEQSRGAATQLQQALGAELQAALTAGGPLAAIDVCSERAPAIAARLSAEAHAQVGRTSLQVRNPGNAPDAAARDVLLRFEQDLAAGAEAPLEQFERHPDGSARYLRTITTQPMCVVCHGQHLSPEVAAAIARQYPQDRATGYAVGDLRGAFIVDWPPGVEPAGVEPAGVEPAGVQPPGVQPAGGEQR